MTRETGRGGPDSNAENMSVRNEELVAIGVYVPSGLKDKDIRLECPLFPI